MAENTINVKVKQRTDTESNWASKNPVLLKGEMAISSDKNNKYKIGDGTSVWSALSYAKADLSKSDVTTALGYPPPTTNTTYNDVTQSTHGLMTATDKKKLDGIASGATKVTDSTVAGWGYKKTDTNTWRPVETTLTNENLNNVTIAGFYSAGGGNTVVNKPNGVEHFGMIVVHRASGSYYVQILFNDSASWRRFCVNGTWGNWSQDKLTDTVYTHPSYTAKSNGLYKITVNSTGHVSGTTAVTKSDITALGIPSTDTNTWRPLGTTADTACAGNDSRLSNARPASDVSAWAKASTKPTYTWNEIESKPSTFTPASHSHNAISMYGSNTINSTANDTTTKWGLYNNSIHFYSNTNRLTDQPSQYGFLHNISSGNAEVHQVWYEQASGSVYHRGGNASGWAGSWRRFLDTGNYNSYVPTKTGGGASGTWGINITGKATTAGTADIANSVAWGNVSGKPSTYTPSSHTHTKSQITDFPTSMPASGGNSSTVNGHTVNSNVPANAKFTDTWRGVQNNLTSTATDQSLSAYQGKVLKDLVDKKTTFTYSSTQPTSPASNAVWIG